MDWYIVHSDGNATWKGGAIIFTQASSLRIFCGTAALRKIQLLYFGTVNISCQNFRFSFQRFPSFLGPFHLPFISGWRGELERWSTWKTAERVVRPRSVLRLRSGLRPYLPRKKWHVMMALMRYVRQFLGSEIHRMSRNLSESFSHFPASVCRVHLHNWPVFTSERFSVPQNLRWLFFP